MGRAASPAAHAEEFQCGAEVRRERAVRLDRVALRHRIGQFQRRRVQHLPADGHQARIPRMLEPERPVADTGETRRCEMAAYLVRTARLDADLQEGSVLRNLFAHHVADGLLAVKRRIYALVHIREASGNYSPILLAHLACLEHLDGGKIGRIGFCEQETA